MRRKVAKRALTLTALAMFVVLLAACASVTEPTETPIPTPRTALTAIAKENRTEWHYVALGDSTTFYPHGTGPSQPGMIFQYIEMLEQDLGVDVVLSDYTSGGGGTVRLIERLQSFDMLRDALVTADVVTLQIPIHNLDSSSRLYHHDPQSCGGEDNQDCLREAFDQHKRDTETIIAEVTTLCDPSEVLIRARDTYLLEPSQLYDVNDLKERGDFDAYNGYWRDAQKHLHAVAQEHGIPVAKVYDKFMGLDGTGDPAAKGWLMDDRVHPNEEGAHVMAQLMRDLGYAYAPSDK